MKTSDFLPHFQLKPLIGNNGYPHTAKKSGVLLPLADIQGQLHVLLCKRPDYLKHHPAQICFPGGKKELVDNDLKDTAYRETQEELSIKPADINLIGEMQSYWTLTGFEIKPYIGFIDINNEIIHDENEVSEVFFLPFSQLAEKDNWQELSFYRKNKEVKLKGIMTPHGLLWGATAQIILNLIKQVND